MYNAIWRGIAATFRTCEYNPDVILRNVLPVRAPPAIGASVVAEPHAVISVRLLDEVVDVYNFIVAWDDFDEPVEQDAPVHCCNHIGEALRLWACGMLPDRHGANAAGPPKRDSRETELEPKVRYH